MDTENTPSPYGLWQKKISISGHSGSGYLEFTGNSYETGPATSPLEYTLKINQAGLYYLHLHCERETVVINGEPRTDVANDCYVRVEGDYNAGPNAGNTHGDYAPLSMLQSNTKFFGGNDNAFVWASDLRLDAGGDTNKRVAIYDFEAGQTYKLVVAASSKAFELNCIVFRNATASTTIAQNLSTPESNTTGAFEIRPPAGRLAIVTDGNSPDPDDIGANAVIFGLLNGSGLRDWLVHFSHSCDFVKPDNVSTADELRRQNKLHDVCVEGIGFFGPFNNLTAFYNCRTQQTAAVNNLRDAINASTASDPLWIIEAG